MAHKVAQLNCSKGHQKVQCLSLIPAPRPAISAAGDELNSPFGLQKFLVEGNLQWREVAEQILFHTGNTNAGAPTSATKDAYTPSHGATHSCFVHSRLRREQLTMMTLGGSTFASRAFVRRRIKRFVIEESSASLSAASSCSKSVAPGSLPTRIGEAYRRRNVCASPKQTRVLAANDVSLPLYVPADLMTAMIRRRNRV